MKKIIKWLSIVLCTALMLTVLYFVFGFFGNPLSYLLAKHSANQYLEVNFGDSTFQVEDVGYNFKTGDYYAHMTALESQDSYFTVYFDSLGRYTYDTHDSIKYGYNTYSRINEKYWDLVKSKLYEGNGVINSSIAFGDLKTTEFEVFTYTDAEGVTQHYRVDKDYGLDISTLELDQEYDILALGQDYGRICLYVHDPEVTVERAAKLLLEVKNYLDANNVPFHGIDFHLCEPNNAEGQMTGEQITLFDFLYSDIYEDGLVDRVQEHWNAAREHYAIQDAETAKLVKEYQ